ncbi:Alpha-(1,3)-fucosyltransferase 5 [Holothuria leucospilota]|uniref:Fucosyltransferase n=1 Tax=Holothuria leucospilota TaxID=206669 RepID=A0A9Q0YC48_HOLLE|nr:Alpha-(1,3)-fucosyltransferase 5 [Holothuria leucospilota]
MPRNNLLKLFALGVVIFVTYLYMQQCIRGKDIDKRFADRPGKSESLDNSLIRHQAGNCNKTFLIYGMKPYWKKFLTFKFMSRYRYLINFPREISCPDLNCHVYLKFSEQAKDLGGVDVVIFTNNNEWLSLDMWKWTIGNRTDGQKWIFISTDSPRFSSGLRPPDQYADLAYDWFASYKLDSDIYQPYGFYKPYKQPHSKQIDLKKFVTGKIHFIAWMSSSCNSLPWNRVQFADELKSLIHMDTYGACGDTPVPWHNEKVVRGVLSNYKFYLSLENSCCVDYITEKFWRSLDFGLVPVVVGASYEQYLKVAPPKSFVHVDQFQSIQKLAEYLILLHNDDEKYLEFHRWRNLGEVVSYNQDEKYISPLMNNIQCAILENLLAPNLEKSEKVDFLGSKWSESCGFCGHHEWIQHFQPQT